MAEHVVAERYGTNRRRRIDKILGWIVGGAMVLGGILFLIFDGLPTGETTIEFRDLAHVIDEEAGTARLTYEVTAAAGSEVVCAITALNQSFATVGYSLVALPVSEQRTRQFVEEVRTINPATAITVKECWIQPETD